MRLLLLLLVAAAAAVAGTDAAAPRASQSVASYMGLHFPADAEIPCRLNLVFLSSPAAADRAADAASPYKTRPLQGLRDAHVRGWFGHLDSTVRHRTVYRKRGGGRARHKWGSHEEAEQFAPASSVLAAENPVARHKYRFHTLRLDATVAETLGAFLGRIARKEPTTAAGDTRYTIDVDEVTPVLAKLVELLGSHGDGLALASSLFVLDVPVAVGNQPIARYAYRRGWSHVEMAALVKKLYNA